MNLIIMFTFRFNTIFQLYEDVTSERLQFGISSGDSISKYISLKISLESSVVQTIKIEKSFPKE